MAEQSKKLSGILVIDKPEGATSRQIDNRIKKLVKPSKVGHLGTLDPFAGGVLPVLIGNATRLAEYLDKQPKVYSAIICVGISTDTWDITGEVTDVGDASDISDELIIEGLKSFEGEIEQKIPPYSAVKRGGKRAYKLARKGKKIDPGSKKVVIHDFEGIEVARDDKEYEPGKIIRFIFISFKVICNRGTYIRSLAVELGERLNMPATLVYLRRISSSGFSDNIAVKIKDLSEDELHEDIARNIISPRFALPHLREINVDEDTAEKVLNGIQLNFAAAPGQYKIVFEDRLLALVEKQENEPTFKYLCVLKD